MAPAHAILAVIPLLFATSARGQNDSPSDSSEVQQYETDAVALEEPIVSVEPKVFRHALLGAAVFDDEDFFLGGSYRFSVSPQHDLGLQVTFTGRMHNKVTIEQLRKHFFLQREESFRVMVGATADKILMVSRVVGLHVGAGGAYSWGGYEGTEAKPDSGWTALADAGLTLRLPIDRKSRFIIRAGYQYADRFSSAEHMAYIGLGAEV